jgi:hypothetical protein
MRCNNAHHISSKRQQIYIRAFRASTGPMIRTNVEQCATGAKLPATADECMNVSNDEVVVIACTVADVHVTSGLNSDTLAPKHTKIQKGAHHCGHTSRYLADR